MVEFAYESLLPIGPDTTEYRLITKDGIDVVDGSGWPPVPDRRAGGAYAR